MSACTRTALTAVLVVLLAGCQPKPIEADIIFSNGAIYTANAAHDVAVIAVILVGTGVQPSRAEDAKKLEFFETRIRPVFVEHCYECHSADSSEGACWVGPLFCRFKVISFMMLSTSLAP